MSAWEKESFSLLQFLARGGFVGLLPLFLAVLAWPFFWSRRPDSIHHPIASIVGIMLSVLVFIVLFIRRTSLRETMWAAEIHRVSSPSPALIGGGSFLVGLLSMVGAVALHKLWQPPGEFIDKLIFAAVYSLAYVGFTGGLTLLPLGTYLGELNERVPQPIFVNTDRLIEVVLRTAATSLRGSEGAQAIDKQIKDFEVLEVGRNPVDGSIRILVKEHRPLPQPDNNADPQPVKKDRTWLIDADKWGRIRALRPSQASPAGK